MTPERWQAVRELLDAALERALPERSAFLTAACGADAALRSEVESLLAADRDAAGFLERPAAWPAAEPNLVERLQGRLEDPQFGDELLGLLLVVPETRPFHQRTDFSLTRQFDGVVKESP